MYVMCSYVLLCFNEYSGRRIKILYYIIFMVPCIFHAAFNRGRLYIFLSPTPHKLLPKNHNKTKPCVPRLTICYQGVRHQAEKLDLYFIVMVHAGIKSS